MLEIVLHPVKEILVGFFGVRDKVWRSIQFFEHCPFVARQVLWNPDVDIYKQVAFSIRLKMRQAFAFKS